MLIKRYLLLNETDGIGGDAGGGAPAIETPAPDAGTPPTDAPAEPATTRDAIEQALAKHETEAVKTDEQRARDERGRFAKQQREEAAARMRNEQPGVPKPDAGAPPAPKADERAPAAPASWKPEAKAAWEKLPPEVRSEVARREVETARVLQESAQARAALGSMQGLLAPFAQNIQAAGVDPVTMTRQLFEADHQLRHGTTAHKAQVVANIIKTYGVDIAALDGVLAGQPVQENPQEALIAQLRRELQQQLQPVQGFMQTVQQRQQETAQRMRAEADAEVAALASQPHFEEVREDMADILEGAARRGVAMSLETAYNRALRVHPVLGEEVARRAFEQQRQGERQAAQRARAAQVSRPGGAPAGHGAPGAGNAADTVRGAIEAAFDAHST